MTSRAASSRAAGAGAKANVVEGRALFEGTGTGALLTLTAPLSLWGGVDPSTGRIVQPRHPQVGTELAGRVVAIGELVGSSSSASVMLELVRCGKAPAALILRRVDAILVVGCIAARELGLAAPPMVEADLAGFAEGTVLRVRASSGAGIIEAAGDAT